MAPSRSKRALSEADLPFFAKHAEATLALHAHEITNAAST
jgi:hypothetical protein